MRSIVAAVVLFSLQISANAQADDSTFIKHLSDEILMNGKAYDNLHTLTKSIGGRLAGSPGMVKAEHWGEGVMKSYNPDKVWLQQCMVPHWVRGGQDEAFMKTSKPASKVKLDVLALGNSQGSGGKTITAEVVAVKSFDELEAKKDQLKGKIVFYDYHFNDSYVSTFLAYRDAGQYRGAGPSRASKYGAIGVIVRSLSNSTDNNPHTGATRYDSAFPIIPAVAVGLRDADKLYDAATKGTVTVEMKTYAHFLPDTIGHNVIGEIRGSEFPDEIITVGGHLDSWDVCEGAHDDGAGVVQTMEILRAFKAVGYKPKRTIRFVLFANEENGLRGGTKYAEEAKAKNEKHIFAMESDAGGFTPRSMGLTGTEAQYQKFAQWKSLVAPYGCSEFNRGGGGSDIGPLNRTFGTPVSSMNPDSQRYFDIHHARNDVFEAVNKRELQLGSVNMAAVIYLVDKYGM
jgi:carboxypeptidase Q